MTMPGDQLRAFRESREVSVNRLAYGTGLPAADLRGFEAGTRALGPEKREIVAGYFGVWEHEIWPKEET